MKPVPFWKFWSPRSGAAGGAILGALFCVAPLAFAWLMSKVFG